MKQEDINQLLVDKAKEGKVVVRLKGGDPFVFGRGGEEALLLVENKIPFEIVPGITSAISVPAYAGIPVTHRGVATSFAVITGHEDPTKAKSNMKWDKLATGVDTLVFLMGVENLPHITSKLIENGRSAETPAAVIRWGTKLEQEVLITTVGKAAEAVATKKLKPPAIFIVGDVVNLREQLAWFDNKPLFGKTVLVTRAREQASALTFKLENLGAKCIEAPVIKIMEPDSYAELDNGINQIADYQWLIFTSANGVEYFFNRLQEQGKDSRVINAKVVAIGVATAQALRHQGIIADIVPVEFVAEGIVDAIKAMVKTGDKVLIPRAKVAREVLPQKLRELGAVVDVATAYQTVIGDVDKADIIAKIENREIDLITFTSSSTVTNLIEMLGAEAKKLINSCQTACIGPITAKTCIDNDIEPDAIATDYTIDGLTEIILNMIEKK